jgi:hypothetical protein
MGNLLLKSSARSFDAKWGENKTNELYDRK